MYTSYHNSKIYMNNLYRVYSQTNAIKGMRVLNQAVDINMKIAKTLVVTYYDTKDTAVQKIGPQKE